MIARTKRWPPSLGATSLPSPLIVVLLWLRRDFPPVSQYLSHNIGSEWASDQIGGGRRKNSAYASLSRLLGPIIAGCTELHTVLLLWDTLTVTSGPVQPLPPAVTFHSCETSGWRSLVRAAVHSSLVSSHKQVASRQFFFPFWALRSCVAVVTVVCATGFPVIRG